MEDLTREEIRGICELTNRILTDVDACCYFYIPDDQLGIKTNKGMYFTYIRTRDKQDFIHLLSRSCMGALICDQCDPNSILFKHILSQFHLRFKNKKEEPI